MESRSYWQHYGELKKWPFERQAAGKTGEKIAWEIFMHGGRSMSLEVYLAVPTFIRRGLRIAV